MRNNFDTIRVCIAIGVAVAMLFSTMLVFTGETTAEPMDSMDNSIPPIPPYTIYGMIFDVSGTPVSDATVTITNQNTGESIDADVYENGAYEAVLEDLSSGYKLGDEIEILVATNSQTIAKILTVKQIGFGERVDVHFNDGKDAKSETPSTSTPLNNAIESTMMSDEPVSINSEPVRMKENSEPIIIDPQITPSNNEPIAEITLTDMRAPPYYRLAFTDKENELRFTLRNDGDERVIVIVDLYHVEPDGVTESFLKTVHFGTLLPGREKFRNVFEDEEGWIPTERGRNWIRGEIYIQEKQNRIFVDEFKESFNVVPGWRPVLELGTTTIAEPTVWDNLTVVINGDLNIAVTGTLSIPGSDVIAGNLNVSGAYDIDPGSSHDMEATYDGQYMVQINSTGTFNVYGKLWNNPDNYHYWFYMNGTLNLDGIYGGWNGTIENTHGPSDLSQPGGIICTTDNVLIKNGATVRYGKTHGIWLEGSDAVIRDSFVCDNGGDGIVCVGGSSPQIEGDNISWNERYGIRAENSAPMIRNNPNIQYNRNHGIYINNVWSGNAIIDNNIIQENFASGIYCNNTNITISNNTISLNGLGLKFRDDMEPVLSSGHSRRENILKSSVSDELSITKRSMTVEDIEKMKELYGISQEGENYNITIDGHGTGLRPPSEEEWNNMVGNVNFIESITSQKEVSGYVDHSMSPYFPPIGNQDGQQSCACWAVGYYTKTFQEAKEHAWNLSEAEWNNSIWGPTLEYQRYIMSPNFVWNQCNCGVNGGTTFSLAMDICYRVGICSWENMSFCDYDAWPSEMAWREAPWYRTAEGGQWLSLANIDGINSLKTWLDNGNLAIIAVDAYQYPNLVQVNSQDIWTNDSYQSSVTNHANTIVGYNDSFGPYMENSQQRYGAFKVANSWGTGWNGDNDSDGMYWISYECMMHKIKGCFFFNDRIGYEPKLISTFQIEHDSRGECDINLGIGDRSNPFSVKRFDAQLDGGNHPFPANKIAFDITEFTDAVPILMGKISFCRLMTLTSTLLTQQEQSLISL